MELKRMTVGVLDTDVIIHYPIQSEEMEALQTGSNDLLPVVLLVDEVRREFKPQKSLNVFVITNGLIDSGGETAARFHDMRLGDVNIQSQVISDTLFQQCEQLPKHIHWSNVMSVVEDMDYLQLEFNAILIGLIHECGMSHFTWLVLVS